MAQTLKIRVKPRARSASLAQLPDGTWEARLKSPPVEGKANQELVALVAKQFRCKKGDVAIKAGAAGRTKLLKIGV